MEQILQFYKNSIESQDRSTPYIEASNDLYGFNCSDIPIDRYEKLFQKYQTEKGKSSNVIEAFDKWILERLPVQIMNQKIEDPDKGTIIYFDNVRIYRPYMVGVSEGEPFEGLPDKNGIIPMYPRDALIRQLTYSSEIKVDIYSRQKSGDNTFEKQLLKSDVIIGQIPIIKGSYYCWLRGMTDEEKVAVGECFNDPQGYFIVGGMEKVIISKENIRVGQMVIAKWDTKKPLNGIRMYSLITKSSILISLNVDHKNGNLIEVYLNEKSPFPVFILSLFLEYIFDEELVTRSDTSDGMLKTCRKILENIIIPEIISYVLPGEVDQIKARLLSTITKTLWLIEKEIISVKDNEKIDPVDILSKIIDKTKADKKNMRIFFKNLIDDIRMNVFPTSADDSIENEEINDFDRRRRMLSKLVATYTRHLEGFRPEDDRDSYMIKRIDTVGRQMEVTFNSILGSVIKDFTVRSLTIDNQKFTTRFENRIRTGFKSSVKKENFSEPIQRLTPAAIYSQLQRVTIRQGSEKSAVESVRTIQPTQVGYICTGETPDGKNCGILKNLTTLCWISIPRDNDIIEDIISEFMTEEKEKDTSVPILLNGNILGWLNDTDYIDLKRAIKTNINTYDVPVAFNYIDSQVDIFSSGSIPTRPLLTVDPETNLIRMEDLTDEKLESMTMDDLVINGYIEYNSPIELDSRYPASSGGELWRSLNKGYTYIKIAEYVPDIKLLIESHSSGSRLDEQPFTHAEIIPHFQFGYSASCVPKGNHNKGPRITYQSSMLKQAISGYHSGHAHRYDSGFKLHQFPTRTMFETSTHKPIGLNVMPTTATAIIAMYVRSKNNEDSLVGKIEYLDNNLRYIYYSTNTISLRATEKIDVRPENEEDPILHAIYKASDDVSSDLIGFPKLGSFVEKGDAILAKYTTKMDPSTGTTKYIKSYSTVGIGKEGYIVGVEVIRGNQNSRIVRIKIAQYRRQIIGDKVASRYSQKGTWGEIVPERDLPRIVGGPNDGVVPDILFNPHSIPSRLTQGKILEILATKASFITGKRINASAFGEYENDDYMKVFEQILIDNGMESSGLETMRHPDGTMVEAKIFVGGCSYQVLKHHVADKIQVRDAGRYEPLTQQPVRGRFKEGGIRIGEMERDAMISHGNAHVVMDRMMNSSDYYRVIVCKKCGNIAQSNFEPRETTCTYCSDSKEFGVVTLPYISHLIIRMLNAAGIHIHFRF